ncbi:cache domain-containing protein [Methanolobus sp. ZRKC3]|uniref:PDC sensor domain-containing protein n=1 Tax=Methanolobus sp. ZRKC3 TaxID=3125786 RepID=UPI00324BFCEC
MQPEKFQKLMFRTLLLLCVVSFLLLVYHINVQETPEELEDYATDMAKYQAVGAVGKINQSLTDMMNVTTSIAEDLSSGELKEDQVVQRINETLENHKEFYGIAAAYNPSVKHSINGSGLYAPYVRREQGELRFTLLEEDYDYTQEDNETSTRPRTIWYNQPLDIGEGCWIEPYFGTASNKLVVSYALPFYNASAPETPAGVVAGVYSLDCMRGIVGSLDLWGTGYGFIITENGTIVSYPIQEYLGQNIAELEKTDDTLRVIHQNMSLGKQSFTNPNNFTGQTSQVFFNNIPSTNWTMGIVFVEEEIFQEGKTFQQHTSIKISMAFIAFLFFLSTLIFHVEKGSSRSLWAVAIILSVLCLGGIGHIWYLNLHD